jgi:Secretion system C-terminal sorting domain
MNFIKITWVALLCLLCSTAANAQQLDTNMLANKPLSFHQFFDSVSAKGLITARIPNGVLYDRVYPWSNLANWDSYRYTCKTHLYQTWYDLDASTYTKSQGVYSFTEFKNAINSYSSITPIIVYDYRYAMIDSNAFNDTTLSIDSVTGAYRDNNLSKAPYRNKYAQLGGLYIDKVLKGETIMLSLDNQFLLQNTGKKLCYVKIWNKTDNTNNIIYQGVNAAIRFDVLGIKKLKMTFVFTDSSKFIARQKIQVLKTIKKTRALFNPESFMVTSNILFQGYDELEATNSYGDAHILYRYLPGSTSQTETTLRKPIIFLDGYDALNKRQFDQIYRNYITVNKGDGDLAEKLRENGYDIVILNFPELNNTISLSDPPDLGFISPNNPLVIPIQVQNASGQLVDRKNANGDIINTDGGTDYIERNAMVFIRLLQMLNTRLAAAGSTEPMVIVGPSMGGQISRYGLAYMEQQQFLNPNDPQWNHNCRLYMSFDSPHDGANISIGLQQALNYLGNFYGEQMAKNAFETQIYSVAARQMLIEHMEGLNSTSDFFTRYHDGLNNNGFPGMNNNGLAGSHGYPMNCRKVSLVNGSGDGVKLQPEGFEALYAHGDIQYAGISTYGIDMHLRFMPAFGQIIRTFEAQQLKKDEIPGWSVETAWWPHIQLAWGYNPTPPIGFSGILPTPLGMVGGIGQIGVSINQPNLIKGKFHPFTDYYRYFNVLYITSNNNSHGSMDIVPGGLITDIDEIYNPIAAKLYDPASVATNVATSHFDQHCFTPAISCLGFRNNNFPWSDPVNNRNLLCNNGNELFFDGYYAPSKNEAHVSMTKESALWAFQEIQSGKIGSNCNFDPCITDKIYTISGELNPCDGNQYTYSISPTLPANVQVDWSEFNVFQTVGTTTNSQATFNISSNPFWTNGVQDFILHASIINPCGANVILKLPFKAFKSPTIADYNPSGYGGFNLTYELERPDYLNAIYTWYETDPSITSPPAIPVVTTTNINPFGPYSWDNNGQTHEVWVQISSPCLGKLPITHLKFSFPERIVVEHVKYDFKDYYDCSLGGFEYEDQNTGGWGEDDQNQDGDQSDDQGDGQGQGQDDHDDQYDDWGGGKLAQKNENKTQISISPNPSSTYWNVTFDSKKNNEVKYSIIDITGKVILDGNMSFDRNKNFQINIQNLCMGIYVLSIQTDNKIFKFKVIKN